MTLALAIEQHNKAVMQLQHTRVNVLRSTIKLLAIMLIALVGNVVVYVWTPMFIIAHLAVAAACVGFSTYVIVTGPQYYQGIPLWMALRRCHHVALRAPFDTEGAREYVQCFCNHGRHAWCLDHGVTFADHRDATMFKLAFG